MRYSIRPDIRCCATCKYFSGSYYNPATGYIEVTCEEGETSAEGWCGYWQDKRRDNEVCGNWEPKVEQE